MNVKLVLSSKWLGQQLVAPGVSESVGVARVREPLVH